MTVKLQIYKHARAAGMDRKEAAALAAREVARVTSAIARMGTHAPTPWSVQSWAGEDDMGFADDVIRIVCAEGHVIAAVSDDAPFEEANATGARIVECVNALTGVHDPASYLETLRAMSRMLDDITRPR